jgi:antirestriction protein ArdC
MKREQAKNIADQALERLAEALASGSSATLRQVLAASARFHRYSFRNVMLIASQRPDATNVAGFNAWRKLGRFVKKGEKGIVIIAPVPVRRDDTAPAEEPGELRDTGIRFKAAYVFDISQTDGEPLPELAAVAGDPGSYTERLKQLVAAKGITLEYTDALESADGRSHGGRIEIRPGLPPAHEFEVLAHELAHEMLHHGDIRLPRRVRELEAEATAFVICEGVGLTAEAAASDYIQLYQGDAESLTSSLERIQSTASEILSAIIGEE